MNYYKVVFTEREQGAPLLTACRNSGLQDMFRVQYVPGQIVEPAVRDSKLFVFASLPAAKAWGGRVASMSSGFGFMQVWSCKCWDVGPIVWIPDPYEARQFWLTGVAVASRRRIEHACTAAAVQLVDRIWTYKI